MHRIDTTYSCRHRNFPWSACVELIGELCKNGRTDRDAVRRRLVWVGTIGMKISATWRMQSNDPWAAVNVMRPNTRLL